MQPIRVGPSNRGPFQGPIIHNDGSTGEVRRAPLYVNAPTKKWFTSDVFPNIAALAAIAATTFAPQAPIDPVITKRIAPQIDVSPNIAVQSATYQPPAAIDVPVTAKKAAQPDLYPNLSAQTEVVPAIRPPFFMAYKAVIGPTPDVLPNIAVKFQTVVVQGTPEPVFTKRAAQQPDLSPNIAVKGAPTYTPPPALDVPVSAKKAQQPDILPNIAVAVPVVAYNPPAALDLNITRKWTQYELFPNLSAQTETVPVIRSPFYMAYKPVKGPIPDLSPNIAATAQPPPALSAQPLVEPVIWKRPAPQIDIPTNVAVMLSPAVGNVTTFNDLPSGKWTQIDLYPNLAVTVAPAPIPLLVATDPWINKRYWPQVEVFQNQAIYVTQVAQQIPAPIEPTIKRTLWQQPDVLPNIAVNFTFVPPPPVTTGSNAPTSGGGGGKRDWDRREKHQKRELVQHSELEAVQKAERPGVELAPAPVITHDPATAQKLLVALTPVVDRGEDDDEEAIMLLLS